MPKTQRPKKPHAHDEIILPEYAEALQRPETLVDIIAKQKKQPDKILAAGAIAYAYLKENGAAKFESLIDALIAFRFNDTNISKIPGLEIFVHETTGQINILGKENNAVYRDFSKAFDLLQAAMIQELFNVKPELVKSLTTFRRSEHLSSGMPGSHDEAALFQLWRGDRAQAAKIVGSLLQAVTEKLRQ